MSTQIQNVRTTLRDDGRGIVSEYIISGIKLLRDRFGIGGYAVGVIGIYIVIYFLFSFIFGTISSAFPAGAVTGLASLSALAYTGWVSFLGYEEYTERVLSRDISQRPSIATVDDAFRLLQSEDQEARQNASFCLSAVVSTSPKYVINTTEAPPDEIVEYLLPYLRSSDDEVSDNVGNAIAFMARDYPESVKPYQDELLDLVTNQRLTGDIRGHLTTAIGFLALSQGGQDEDLEDTALTLSDDGDPQVRIGACYILAGIGTRNARERLQEIATGDPENEVREHAEELV